MLKVIVLTVSMLLLAAQAAADNCFGCVLGIWDDPTLASNRGTILPNQPKSVYLGIRYQAPFRELTGVEFSVAGIDGFEHGFWLFGVSTLPGDALLAGSLSAPEDTSLTSTGRGGFDLAYRSCLPGDRALLKIDLFTNVTLVNKVLWVKRAYPPTNSNFKTPLFLQCDAPMLAPDFTATRLTGSWFILNWNGDPRVLPPDPTVGVETSTWSAVKEIFR